MAVMLFAAVDKLSADRRDRKSFGPRVTLVVRWVLNPGLWVEKSDG